MFENSTATQSSGESNASNVYMFVQAHSGVLPKMKTTNIRGEYKCRFQNCERTYTSEDTRRRHYRRHHPVEWRSVKRSKENTIAKKLSLEGKSQISRSLSHPDVAQRLLSQKSMPTFSSTNTMYSTQQSVPSVSGPIKYTLSSQNQYTKFQNMQRKDSPVTSEVKPMLLNEPCPVLPLPEKIDPALLAQLDDLLTFSSSSPGSFSSALSDETMTPEMAPQEVKLENFIGVDAHLPTYFGNDFFAADIPALPALPTPVTPPNMDFSDFPAPDTLFANFTSLPELNDNFYQQIETLLSQDL